MRLPRATPTYDPVDQDAFRRILEAQINATTAAPQNGKPSTNLLGLYNVKDYGAKGDGSTDDVGPIQAAVNAAATAGGICYFPQATYIVSTALTLSVGKRNVLIGAGLDGTTIKHKTGGTVLDWSAGTHVVGSFGARIQDLTFDGNNGSGPVVQASNLTMMRIERVNIYGNGASGSPATAIGLKLVSIYDSRFTSIYVATCGGGAASNTTTPCVLLDCDNTAANNFNNCKFDDLHIEPGPQDGLLLYMLGNVTNPITDNQFFGLKTHGDPGTGRPDNALVKMSQYCQNNRFYEHIIGFGKSATLAQVECDGSRNSWYGCTCGLTIGLAPKYAFNFSANSDSCLLLHPSFKTPGSYTNCVNIAGSHNKVFLPPGSFSGATLYADTGTGTVVISDDTSLTTGLKFYSPQGVVLPIVGFNSVNPVSQPTGFGTPTGVARLINFPGATATLAQTTGAMADLLTVLKNYGLLGA